MRRDVGRRAIVLGASASALAVGYARAEHRVRLTAPSPYGELERRTGGKLGVHAAYGVDRAESPHFIHRTDERFPMCSTFKFILAACVLARADAGQEQLGALVQIPPEAVLSYAPVTSIAAKEGRSLTVEQLCEAAVKVSDNTAANLLLERVGGPAGLTRWMRKYDQVTRLDRNEPSLNTAIPGDPRDTTEPFAMVGWLGDIDQGRVLRPSARTLLLKWMRECTTGLAKLRAGAPAGWIVADKTGNNGSDTMADVAILTPPQGPPLYIAAFVTQSKLRGPELDGIFAEITRITLKAYHV